jgi:serine/threonine-protein kinase
MAEAEAPFRKALELAETTQDTKSGNYFLTLANYANALHRQGKLVEAHAVFDRLFRQIALASDEGKTGNDAYYGREIYGLSLSAEGRLGDAVAVLEEVEHAYTARPNWEGQLRRMRRYLGDAYALAGRPDDARRILKSALDERVAKNAPDYPPLLTLRERWGRFLLSQGESDAAKEQFVEVLAQMHERTFESAARAHAGLAKIALALGDTAGALASSRSGLDVFDHISGQYDVRAGPAVWLVHSEVLRASGDAKGAREWAQKALDASRHYDDPSAASIRDAEAAVRAAAG